MSRAFFVLWNDAMRKKVADLVLAAEKETRVTLQEPKRTLDHMNMLDDY